MVITDVGISQSLEKCALDIIGPLSKTKNDNIYILTMQDSFSKFSQAVPLKDQTAHTIADAFIKKWLCVFGAPKIVLTDRGQNFLSKLMQRISKRFGIKRIHTTSFTPRSNGSLERSHHALAQFLKMYSSTENCWDEWLDICMLNYNSSMHESSKLSPFEILFGQLARLPSSEPLRENDLLPTYQGCVRDLVSRLNGIRKLAYDN